MCGKDQQGAADVSPPMRAARATLLTPNGTHPIRRTSRPAGIPPYAWNHTKVVHGSLCSPTAMFTSVREHRGANALPMGKVKNSNPCGGRAAAHQSEL